MSQLGWLFPIYGKIKHVPNHQPAGILLPISIVQLNFELVKGSPRSIFHAELPISWTKFRPIFDTFLKQSA